MSKRGVAVPVIVALAVMVALFFGSFMLGQYPIPPAGVVDIIGSRLLGFECSQSDMAQTIVWKVRLPRIMAALLIGAALSVAGAVYQGLFKNPHGLSRHPRRFIRRGPRRRHRHLAVASLRVHQAERLRVRHRGGRYRVLHLPARQPR